MIQPLFWSHHGLWGSKAARAPPSSHPLPSLTPFWTSVVDQTPLISSHMGRVFPKVLPMTVLVSRTEGTRLIRAMLWIQEGQTQLLGTASYSSQAASTGFSVGFHWHRMGRVQECVIPSYHMEFCHALGHFWAEQDCFSGFKDMDSQACNNHLSMAAVPIHKCAYIPNFWKQASLGNNHLHSKSQVLVLESLCFRDVKKK